MALCAGYTFAERGYPVKSLFALSIDAVASSLNAYVDSLPILPRCVKSKLLSVGTRRGVIGDKILQHLVHPEVVELDLSECPVSNETLESIAVCVSLRKLDLNPGRNQLRDVSTPALISLFSSLQYLSVLYMRRCPAVSDDVVGSIVDHCQMLRELDLGGCAAVTDFSLHKLKELKHLTSLNVSSSQVTDDGIMDLVEGPCAQSLNEILLESCLGVTDFAIETIVLHCPKVKILIFHGCPVTDASWFALQQLLLKTKVKQLTWTVY